MLLYSLAYQNLRRSFEEVPESFKDQISIQGSPWQTLDLAKILHCRIFRPKLLHRQFHLFSTVLAIKIQQKSENGEIYTVGKNFTLPPAVTGGTNFTYASRSPKCGFWFTYVLMSCVHKCDPLIFFARRWLTSVGNFATTSREGLNVESGFMN